MRIKRASAKSTSLAAPTGGWNARDSLGDMAPADAVYLTNYFPATSDVVQRNGYSKSATGLSGQVETLMNYSSGTSESLFAIAGGKIYDVSAGGAVGAPDVTGLSNSRFQYTNVANAGGNFILCVNGIDKLQGYNGSTWWVDGDGTHDITGVNTENIAHIQLFKHRVWMVEKDSLKAWYLPTDAIAGAAVPFSLQGVAREGGYIMAMGAWTIDAGYGVDDLSVFVTNHGEVIVYKGTDPASATTWELVGIWKLGSPVGRRCLFKYGGDLLYISQDGLVPMSGALQSSRLSPKTSLTDKIQYATSSAISNYGANFGWQVLYFPKENMLFLNVPVAVGQQQQYVMNNITKSWCNFTGWNANCWCLYNDNPYFGGNGYVGKAWDTFADDGENIVATGKQSFNYFSSRGVRKRWTMIRPILFSNASPNIVAGINVDFRDDELYTDISIPPIPGAIWGLGVWGVGVWGSNGLNQIGQWQGVTGTGNCCSIKIKNTSIGINLRWVSTDIVYESGGIL